MASKDSKLVAVLALWALAAAPLGSGCEDEHDTQVHTGDHAHDDEDGGHDLEPVGVASGATCPDDAGMLTYEDFGRPFMEAYCTRCHSSTLSGDARMGAALDHDFDTLEGILEVAEHIDQLAAVGPESNNTQMPPTGPRPTLAERAMLGQWLACEHERM